MAAEYKDLFGYQTAFEFGPFYILRHKNNGSIVVDKCLKDNILPICVGSKEECVSYGVKLIKDLCGTDDSFDIASQTILSETSRGFGNVYAGDIAGYVGPSNDHGYTFDVGMLIVIRPNDVHELYAIEGWSKYYRNVKGE